LVFSGLNKLLIKRKAKQIEKISQCSVQQPVPKNLALTFDNDEDFYLFVNFGYCALCIYEIFEFERDEWLCLLKKDCYPSKVERNCFRSKW